MWIAVVVFLLSSPSGDDMRQGRSPPIFKTYGECIAHGAAEAQRQALKPLAGKTIRSILITCERAGPES